MILLVVVLTYQKDNKMEEKQDMIGVKMPNCDRYLKLGY
jgi:hypothetical protein